MVNVNLVFEDEKGQCDYCKKWFPIGRGEYFNWIEKEEKWCCNYCFTEVFQ